ncbi:Leucine Rich Repeat/Leucine rich repeat [Lotmaria passim]
MSSQGTRLRFAAHVWGKAMLIFLLAWCGACAYAVGPIPTYTATQQLHTRKFLQGFIKTMPDLASNWTGTNFCAWDSITCLVDGVDVGASEWPLIEEHGGSLPELERGTDGSQVVIKTMTLSNNQLTGTLPASWARLSNIKVIGLFGNSLTGTLPWQWAQLPSLVTLTLGYNKLSGTLPSMWSEMTSLTGLYLHFNAFSGRLPYSWADMPTIQYVALQSNQLSGTLPTRWSATRKLEVLYLNLNRLTGSIPETWANITTLNALNLKVNSLCGCKPDGLPSNFDCDSKLLSPTCAADNPCPTENSTCNDKIVNVSPAQAAHTRNFLLAFTTTIPQLATEWTCPNFCAWKYIACTEGAVEVIMPSDGLIGSLPNMPSSVDPAHVAVTTIDISRNWNISGTLPASWGKLTSLKLLSVKYTAISGTLPAAWSGMTSLVDALIEHTKVSGTLPDNWNAMPALRTLNLNNNNLEGTLPASWGAMAMLAFLRLDSNQLTGSIPEEWGGMAIITQAALGNNDFCGCLPGTWITDSIEVSASAALLGADCATVNACAFNASSSSSSSSVSLSSSSSNYVDLNCYGEVPYYSSIEVEHTRLFFELLISSINTLSDLWTCKNFCTWIYVSCYPTHAELKMAGVDLTGWLPDLTPAIIPDLVVVTVLDFSHNLDIDGSFPVSWCTLSRVTHLWLSETMVNGELPSQCSGMTSLRVFDVGNTLLLSSIPDSWSNLKQLETLRLNNNMLIGSLPPSWESMTSLIELDISSAGIKSTLPSTWSNLNHLTILKLQNNGLFGTLPDEWNKMTSLIQLRLDSNNLTGSIPSSYGSLPRLRHVKLEQNHFCGCLPSEWLNGSVVYTADDDLTAPDCATANLCTPILSSSSSSRDGECYAPVPYYTAAQVEATRHVLEAVLNAFNSTLRALWLCPNFCTWHGITCLEPGVILSLPNSGLVGSMPGIPSEANMADVMLLFIDISGNIGITGSLSPDWLKLPNLFYIDTSHCSLSGRLPS